jgi:hypothetical protein
LTIDPDDPRTLDHPTLVGFETDQSAKGNAFYNRMLESMLDISGFENIHAVVSALAQLIPYIPGRPALSERAVPLCHMAEPADTKMSLINSTFVVTKATFCLGCNHIDQAQQQQDSLIHLASAAV